MTEKDVTKLEYYLESSVRTRVAPQGEPRRELHKLLFDALTKEGTTPSPEMDFLSPAIRLGVVEWGDEEKAAIIAAGVDAQARDDWEHAAYCACALGVSEPGFVTLTTASPEAQIRMSGPWARPMIRVLSEGDAMGGVFLLQLIGSFEKGEVRRMAYDHFAKYAAATVGHPLEAMLGLESLVDLGVGPLAGH